MSDLLASINCAPGVLSPDTLSRHLSFLKEALRERTRILSNNGFGIIDSSDPRYDNSSSIKPLWVAAQADDYSKIVVYPGRAVTPNGDVVELVEPTTVSIPGTYRGAESVIIIQYEEVPSGYNSLTIDGQIVDIGAVSQAGVSSILVSSYEALTQDELDNIVVLGTVLWSDSAAPALYTDDSNGYFWNRPWFSSADTVHRSMVGSGNVSEVNPHGTGLNDLSVGRLTIYDQLTSTGMILSKDLSTPGIPGYLCVDQVTADSILIDTNGDVTSVSWFSRPGRFYVKLSAVPNCIHGVVDSNGTEIAVEWIKGTTVVMLLVNVKPTNVLSVYYTRSDAGSISRSDTTNVTFNQCSQDELVIVGGQAKTAISRLSAPVRRYGNVPRELSFQIGSSGQVYIDPTIVVPFTEVTLAANQKIPGDIKIPSQGHIGVSIDNLGQSFMNTTLISFLIEGTDPSGSDISEVLVFDKNNWDFPLIPADYENPLQVHYTTKVFASFHGVTALDTSDYPMTDVNNAIFAVLIKQDPALSKTARLATAFWDGQSMQKLVDARRVLPVVRDGWYGYTSLHQASEAIPGIDDALGEGNSAQLVFAEDFAQPTCLAAHTVEWDGSGLLSVPVIDPALANSSSVLRCYRSRQIPLKVGDADWTRVVVNLFGSDSAVNKYGSVRIVYGDRVGNRGEAVLKPFDRDGSGTVFVGFVNTPWNSISVVVSGKCHGFAAYFVRPSTVDQNYVLVPV